MIVRVQLERDVHLTHPHQALGLLTRRSSSHGHGYKEPGEHGDDRNDHDDLDEGEGKLRFIAHHIELCSALHEVRSFNGPVFWDVC